MSCKDCRMKPCTEAQGVECCKDCKTRCSSMCKTAQELCRKKTTEEIELDKYLESLKMNDRVYSELQSRGIDCVMKYHTPEWVYEANDRHNFRIMHGLR